VSCPTTTCRASGIWPTRSGAATWTSITSSARGQDDVLDSDAASGLVIRGGVLRFLSFAGQLGLSVVSTAVLTRRLGVSRFGQYTTVLSLVAVVAAVTDAGMSNIGTREYAILREPERTEMMRNLLGLRVALTLGGTVIVLAIAVAAGYDEALLLGAVLASLGLVAIVVQHTLLIPLTADLRLGTLSAVDLGRQVLLVGGLVALALGGAGVLPLLAVTLLVNLVLIGPVLLVRGRLSAGLSLQPAAWPPLLRAAVTFSLASAVGVIYIYTVQILTSLVASHHQNGLFAVSFRVFVVAAGVPGIIVSGTLPLLSRAARDDRDRLAHALRRIFETSLIAGVGAALVISAGSGFIVSVIAGPRYAAAAPVLALQAVAIVATFVGAGWSFALLSLHLHRGLLIANAAALAVSIVLTTVLAGVDGARGAAVATIGGEVTLALGMFAALTRGRPQYRPPALVVAKVALAGAIGAALSLVPSMPSLARAVVALAVYAVAIVVTGALPHELRMALRSPLSRR
jgi:O-antigen/teichoic acid export membrane protein